MSKPTLTQRRAMTLILNSQETGLHADRVVAVYSATTLNRLFKLGFVVCVFKEYEPYIQLTTTGLQAIKKDK